jgi:hypothetical protein
MKMNSQVTLPKTAADVTAPATGIIMHPAYAKAVGRFAYIWGWPMINMLNRSAAITKAPQPGRLNGVLPVAPRGQVGMLADYIDPDQTFVTCPNQDVVYGLGFFSLDDEPVVAQVPDFGDRFWVYALYDARTDQFAELGKPYKTKPGFYLLAGPSWKGDKPAGIEAVIRSSTVLANAIPRVFMNDTPEDRKAIQLVINQIVFYPLKDFDGKMKTKDWAQAPAVRSRRVPIRSRTGCLRRTATSRSTSARTGASKAFSKARGSRRSFGKSNKGALDKKQQSQTKH